MLGLISFFIESIKSKLFVSRRISTNDLCKKGFDHTEEHYCITIYKACNRMNCRKYFKVKCRNCALFTQNNVLTFMKNQIVK